MGDSDVDTLKSVSKGEWDFDEEAFADVSDEGLDWIEKILIKDKEYVCVPLPHLFSHLSPNTVKFTRFS